MAESAPSSSFRTAIELYLDRCSIEQGSSPLTIQVYRRELLRFARYLQSAGHTNFEIPGPRPVLQYLGERRAAGAGPATVARALVAIRMCFRFLFSERHIAKDPSASIPTPRRFRKLPEVLSTAEVGKMLALPEADTPRRSAITRSWNCCMRRGSA